jgi:hypothetical protein
MRFIFSLLLLTFCFASTFAQAPVSPVKWNFELKKGVNASEVDFVATATINKGWQIYSVYMADGGPIPTSFTFDEVTGGELQGDIKELSQKIKAMDPLFEMEVIKFKDKAEFIQPIKNTKAVHVKGSVMYMCCDNEKCLPPTSVPFDLH